MKTKKELSIEIEQRAKILAKIVIFYRDAHYLNVPHTNKEKEVANQSFFIQGVRYSFWVITVLELCKLYGGNSDDFTFIKLLNKMSADIKNSDWNLPKNSQMLNDLFIELGAVEIQATIKNIRGLRNQYYAHLDRNPQKTISEFAPNFNEVEKLIDLGKKILKTISQNLDIPEVIIEYPGVKKADNILNDLIELKNYRNKEIRERFNKNFK